jgi:hypothetical protein
MSRVLWQVRTAQVSEGFGVVAQMRSMRTVPQGPKVGPTRMLALFLLWFFLDIGMPLLFGFVGALLFELLRVASQALMG